MFDNKAKHVSIVISLYNEQAVIKQFHENLSDALSKCANVTFEILYVDDGSTDETLCCLKEIADRDETVTILVLSRNFGHQAAIIAGLENAGGDAVIVMDGDGEHPPTLICEMIKSYEMGYDIVIAKRAKDNHIGWGKRVTSNLFYKIINRVSGTYIVPGAADFRMVSRQVVNILNQMQERKGFLRGLVGWIGFKSTIISYKQPQRIAGKPKYSFWSSARLAKHALLSFSKLPLQLSFIIGAGMICIAILEAILVLYSFMIGETSLVPGWASLMMIMLLGNGTMLVMLGIQGYYIGMLIDETKKRPMYILHHKYSQKDKY